MTLVQTGKLQRRPIVLVGRDYWQDLYQWMLIHLASNDYIDQDDLGFLIIAEDAAEAASVLLKQEPVD